MRRVFRPQRLFILVICALVLPLSAQKCQKAPRVEKSPVLSGKEAEAEEALLQIMQDYDAVGLSVAVVKDNEIIYTKAVGKKNIATGEDLETDDMFRIASISKSFAATTVMKLIEEGKLSLEDDVSDLLGFKVRNPRFPDTPITLRMFMCHSSSLKDGAVYWSVKVIDTDDQAAYAKNFYTYAPGTKYNYSNLAYNLIGNIIEKASGQRFDVAVRERVILPLGLEASHNVNDLDKSKFATLYIYSQDEATKEWIKTPSQTAYSTPNLSNYKLGYSAAERFSPTGGIKISAPGLAYYMRMHMNYGVDPATGVRVIREQSSRLMQSPQITMGASGDYCFGLRLLPSVMIEGETMIGHTGSASGLTSGMFFQPEKKFGIVMITNGSRRGTTTATVSYPIVNETVNKLYEIFIKE